MKTEFLSQPLIDIFSNCAEHHGMMEFLEKTTFQSEGSDGFIEVINYKWKSKLMDALIRVSSPQKGEGLRIFAEGIQMLLLSCEAHFREFQNNHCPMIEEKFRVSSSGHISISTKGISFILHYRKLTDWEFDMRKALSDSMKGEPVEGQEDSELINQLMSLAKDGKMPTA